MSLAYIGVGSNVDPEQNIAAALRLLKKAVRPTAVSTFYATAALRSPGDPPFWNGVFQVETLFAPRVLKFDVLRPIEAHLGRRRPADPYAPRTIDLDLLLHENTVLNEPDLQLPSADIAQRPFVAIPLLELAPALVLPGSGRKLAELAAAMPREGLEPLPEFTAKLRREVPGPGLAGC